MLADTGQFGSAAQRLNLTQPGLSLQLKDLEAKLGVTLIERRPGQAAPKNGGPAQLTAAGHALLPQARAILAASDDLQLEARRLAEPLAGRLRLGVIPTVAPYMLPGMLPKLAKAYPQLDLQITEDKTETLVQALRNGQLDVGLLALPLQVPDLTERALFDDPFHLVAAKNHPIWRLEQAAPQDIVSNIINAPLLLLDEGHCLRDQALSFCRMPHRGGHGSAPAGVRAASINTASFRTASLPTLLELVANGMGVTLLPEMAMAREATGNKKLRAQKLALPGASRTIGLLYRPRHSQAAEYEKLAELLS